MSTITVKERPIPMRDFEVRATLDGRKTQMRVVVRPQPSPSVRETGLWLRHAGRAMYSTNGRREVVTDKQTGKSTVRDYHLPVAEWLMEKPLYSLGDRLRVRETWADCITAKGVRCVAYKADGAGRFVLCDHGGEGDPVELGGSCQPYAESIRWKSGQVMPRWASRLTLEVTGVRVERLGDITPADALEEGIDLPVPPGAEGAPNFPADFKKWNKVRQEEWFNGTARAIYLARCADAENHVAAYRNLWEQLHGKGLWEQNPFVWVISFRKLDTPAPGQEER